MTDTAVYIVTAILAVVAVLLFMRSTSSQSLTEQKRADVRRKRAALRSKETQIPKQGHNSTQKK